MKYVHINQDVRVIGMLKNSHNYEPHKEENVAIRL